STAGRRNCAHDRHAIAGRATRETPNQWQNSYLGKPSISFSARGNATYSPVIQLLTCDLWASISVLSASKCLQPSVMRNRCSNVGLPQFVIACAGEVSEAK